MSHAVSVQLTESGLLIHFETDGADASPPLLWPYGELRAVEPPRSGGPLRLALGSDDAARLIVDNGGFAKALREAAPDLERSRSGWFRSPLRLGLGALAAVALAAVVGAGLAWGPSLAARAIPDSWTVPLGNRIAEQIAQTFSADRPQWCTESRGIAALKRLAARFQAGAGSDRNFTIRVLDATTVNAFAAPGGQLIILSGMIEFSHDAEELAGVLAHEMAHAFKRHPTENLIRILGLRAVLSGLLGGGGNDLLASIGGGMVLLKFSRDAEREADAGAVAMLERAGIDPSGLARIFRRLKERGGTLPDLPEYFSTHPDAGKRAETVGRAGSGGGPAMPPEDWQTIKELCRTVANS